MSEKLEYRPVSRSMPDYEEFDELYHTSFPPEEIIPIDEFISMTGAYEACVDAVYDDGKMVGMVIHVDLKGCTFIAFLAIRSATRSKGYGSRIIADIRAKYPGKAIVINVEPASDVCDNKEQRLSRIRFYERNGIMESGLRVIFDSEQKMPFIVLTDDPNCIECYREFGQSIGWTFWEDIGFMDYQAIGIRGDAEFDKIISHFTSMGGEVVLMDPDMIAGKDHVLSAAIHADRAFRLGTNRSKNILTEVILYSAWERQISKALAKMKPKAGRNEYVALLINVDDPKLDIIGMTRDDSLMDVSDAKAATLGLKKGSISYEDQAVENVAMVELLKS